MEWKQRVKHIHERVQKRWDAYSQEDKHYLILGLAGEVGELANLIKKEWRGDNIHYLADKMQEEIGDVRIYLELLGIAYGIDVDKAAQSITDGKLQKRWPEAYGQQS